MIPEYLAPIANHLWQSTLFAALFWFHPLVWWLEARLVDERERACDEEVLRSGNDPAVYAESILKICRFYVQSPLTCASGVSGADLKRRVEDILINRMTVRMNAAKKVLLATTAVAAIALPLVAGFVVSPHASAQTQTTADVPLSQEERAQKLAEQQRPRTVVPFDPKQFDKYVGFYQLGPYTFIKITRQDEHFFDRFGEHFFSLGTSEPDLEEIYPQSPTKFFAKTAFVQISFVTDAQGHATELVWHVNGLEQHARKVEELVVKAAEASLAERVKNKTPSPGTEAMLRRYIAAFQKGEPNYDEITPTLATLVRGELEGYLDYFQKWGALKSLTFDRVLDNGLDMYIAVYEHARVAMMIGPLTPDGKMAMRSMSILGTPEEEAALKQRVAAGKPAPGTEASLRRFIASMEKGQPDYEEMAPGLQNGVRAHLPQALPDFQKLGTFKSLTFKNVGPNGMDIYEAVFENGRAEFRIMPLQPDGIVASMGYRMLPTP